MFEVFFCYFFFFLRSMCVCLVCTVGMLHRTTTIITIILRAHALFLLRFSSVSYYSLCIICTQTHTHTHKTTSSAAWLAVFLSAFNSIWINFTDLNIWISSCSSESKGCLVQHHHPCVYTQYIHIIHIKYIVLVFFSVKTSTQIPHHHRKRSEKNIK